MPVPQPTRPRVGLNARVALGVWVTRARPGAETTAERLRALGHLPWVMPLLAVEPLVDAEVVLDGVGALAFSSANGVRAFAARTEAFDLPIFAVGDATAEAARQAGFAHVSSAAGDVAALGRLIAAAGVAGEVLHLGAETLGGDLAGDLRAAGVAARSAAIYRTVTTACPCPPGPPPDVVLLHSPRAAGVLAGLLRAGSVGIAPDRLDGVGLSRACVAPLRGSGLRSLRAASQPNEDALLALLA